MTNFQDVIARSQSQAMSNKGAADNSTPNEGTATSDNNSNKGGPTLVVFRSLRWIDEAEHIDTSDSTIVSEGDDILSMPEVVNLQECGFRRSPRIAAQKR